MALFLDFLLSSKFWGVLFWLYLLANLRLALMADFHPEVIKGTSFDLTFIFFIGKCSCKMVLRSFFSSHNNETSRQWNISSTCQGAMLRVSFSLPVLRFLKWGKVITLLLWCLILSVRRKLIKCGGAVEEKKESILLLLTFKALKCVHNNCVQTCDIYAPIPSICFQSIPIDINLSINCYLKINTNW